jgi:hypothetical protein
VQDGWTELGVECSVEELESAGFKMDVLLLAAARTTWVSLVVWISTMTIKLNTTYVDYTHSSEAPMDSA